MKGENFYRRNPGNALAGMVGMTLEERGVYNTIIDLLYLTWRPLEDNRAYIAGHCGCAVQKLNPIIGRLIERGKLITFVEDGATYLSNRAFEAERTAFKGAAATRSGRAKVGEKSAGVSEKSAGVGENHPTCDDKVVKNEPVTPLEKRREEKTEKIPVPDGTGAEAPPAEDSDWLEIEAIEDPAKRGWAAAVFVLTRRVGVPEKAARSFIGKLSRDLKPSGDDLWQIAKGAWDNGTQDPTPYFRRAAEQMAERRAEAQALGGITDPTERQQRAWMEDWRDRGAAGWRRHERGGHPGESSCRVRPDIQREFGIDPTVVPFPGRSRSTG